MAVERGSDRDELTLAGYVALLYALFRRNWKLLLIVFVASAVLASIAALQIPDEYEARAILLPSGGGGANSVLGQLSEFTLAMGVDMARTEEIDIYPIVARSELILERVLDHDYRDGRTIRHVLLRGAEPDSLSDSLLLLQLSGKIEASKSLKGGTLTLSYRHHDPYFAAALLNQVVNELETFYRQEMGQEIDEQQVTIDRRILEVSAELALVEGALIEFRESNRGLNQSPSLLQQEDRLRRDVDILSGVLIELTRQLELIKLREAGAANSLRILDRASVPFVPVGPQRTRVVAASVLVAMLIAVVLLIARQGLSAYTNADHA